MGPKRVENGRRIPGIQRSETGITQLLLACREADEAALSRLTPLVHGELQRVERRCMRGQAPDHTLQATALVNEASVRLVDVQQMNWQRRAHFLAMAARLMRRILVDSARARGYQKRGSGALRVSFTEQLAVIDSKGVDMVRLDDALQALAELDERPSRVVEVARAWLMREMKSH